MLLLRVVDTVREPKHDLMRQKPSRLFSYRLTLTFVCAILSGIPCFAQVVTAQYNNARTGVNPYETVLTPRNVRARHFGKLFSLKVDGQVFAQPLYLPQVRIPHKGVHNVLFVVTENDMAYAFDADHYSQRPLWQTSFIQPERGVTTVPADDAQCPLLGPEIGITSTPVIDETTGTIYLVVRTMEKDAASHRSYSQVVHALNVHTGAEQFADPALVQASVDRKTSSGPARVEFNPLRQNQRSALLLSRGRVYVAWASSCDVGDYHGWLMVFDSQTMKMLGTFNTSPDGYQGGIWQSDEGPAADLQGDVFVSTGNGDFNAASGGRDFGDSVLKLLFREQIVSVRDYFTPFNERELNESDKDLGSGGPVLLPPQPGTHPHLLIVAGKGDTLYVLDRDHMGHFEKGNNSHAVQTIRVAPGGAFGSVAYWNQHVFVVFNEDPLKDFELRNGRLSEKPVAQSTVVFHYPGATPTVSANGSTDGIVWAVASRGWETYERPAVLHAFDAANVRREIYTSEQNSDRDRAGPAVRFTVPMVANGHVYVGTKTEIDVYGLLPSRQKKAVRASRRTD